MSIKVYSTWIESGYNNKLTASALEISESGVRARVSEHLDSQVPYLSGQGMTPFQIAEHLRLPDTKRVLSRLNKSQATTFPVNQSRYADIIDSLPMRQLPPPVTITGNAIITGDWQLPTTDYEFMKRVLHVALLFLEYPRKLVIAGDFLNGDGFSYYPKTMPQPTFGTEIKAGKRVVEDLLTVFDEIEIFQGNHEDRVPKRTDAELNAEMVFDMITQDTRVHVSPHGYCWLESGDERYRITHTFNYSINNLKVAETMAHKELCHIIQHHEHHFAIGYDRFKNFLIINNGGLFSQEDMGYVKLRDTKHANMVNGFTMIRDGVPTLFGKYPFTNWSSIDSAIESIAEQLPESIRDVI